MTIQHYLDSLQELPHRSADGRTLADAMRETTHIWSNEACKGYCIAALQAAGYSREQITEVLRQLAIAFDDIAIDDAEQIRNTGRSL